MSIKTNESTNQTLYVLKKINSENLKVLGEDYQRDINENRVAKIIANFNETVANEPKVSFRDGKYYVFDGQHTIAARIAMNGFEHLPILCKVYRGLTERDEAFLFATQNGVCSAPTPSEKMRAWIFGGSTEAIEFKNVTESTGVVLELTDTSCKNHLVCLNTAFAMYKKLGPQMYTDALNVIINAWGGEPESLKMEIIIAVCLFIRLYHNEYDMDGLIWKHRAENPKLIRQAIISDFDLAGTKRHINQIFKIYNGKGKPILEQKF